MTTGASLIEQVLAGMLDEHHESAIIDGALAAFLEFGIRRTSMGEIARRGGVSPATLYRRFANKDAVVTAVVQREAGRFVAAVDARVDRTASAREQVVEGFAAFSTVLAGNRLLRRLLVTEPDTTLPLLTTEAGPLLAIGRGYIADTLRRLQTEHDLPDFDTEPVAEMFARLALSLALTPEGVIPVDDVAAAREFADRHVTALVRL